MLIQTTNARPQIHHRLVPAGRPSATMPDAGPFELMGAAMTFGRNEEIYGEHEPADHLYKVASGAVRTYRVLSDGRRQIGAFHLPGDIFGLEAGDTHSFSAEAIGDARLLLIRRQSADALIERDAQAARQFRTAMQDALHRAETHLMLLVKTARERVAGFLLEMAERQASFDQIDGLQVDPPQVDLPMSRQDIADHLGLTIETVSRTLSALESAGAIALPSARRVVLHRPGTLRRLSA